jgi:hypothetical protein
MLGFAVSGGHGRRGHQQAPPTGQTISAPTVTRRTARVELTRSQLVQERSLLAHPALALTATFLSSYGNFLARSARTGHTSGTRASGRQRPKRSSSQQLPLWAQIASGKAEFAPKPPFHCEHEMSYVQVPIDFEIRRAAGCFAMGVAATHCSREARGISRITVAAPKIRRPRRLSLRVSQW